MRNSGSLSKSTEARLFNAIAVFRKQEPLRTDISIPGLVLSPFVLGLSCGNPDFGGKKVSRGIRDRGAWWARSAANYVGTQSHFEGSYPSGMRSAWDQEAKGRAGSVNVSTCELSLDTGSCLQIVRVAAQQVQLCGAGRIGLPPCCFFSHFEVLTTAVDYPLAARHWLLSMRGRCTRQSIRTVTEYSPFFFREPPPPGTREYFVIVWASTRGTRVPV